jgi:N-acetylmuramoyl-L-alanine amidase
MGQKLLWAISGVIIVGGFLVWSVVDGLGNTKEGISVLDTEPGFDAEPPSVPGTPYTLGKENRYTLEMLRTWTRPEGPLRVGIQVGHLDNDAMPPELAGLEGNTGAVFGSLTERMVNETVANKVKGLLEADGILVDVLPATVPPGYVADAFISLHADGNTNNAVRGFKIAGPRRDYSGQSERLVTNLETSYAKGVPIPKDNNVTRRMTAYYAFNWPRYEHAIHPFTPAAIVEMGFLTNASDRLVMTDQSNEVAFAIAEGIRNFVTTTAPANPLPVVLEEPVQPVIGQIACAPIRAERRGREDETVCIPSVVTSDTHYILDNVATSSVIIGSTISVTGQFKPVQVVDNYFWFPYEVAGFLESPEITTL